MLEIQPQESFDLYTDVIGDLFRVIEKGETVAFSGGDKFYNKFSAYLNFIKAKEEAGKERGSRIRKKERREVGKCRQKMKAA